MKSADSVVKLEPQESQVQAQRLAAPEELCSSQQVGWGGVG